MTAAMKSGTGGIGRRTRVMAVLVSVLGMLLMVVNVSDPPHDRLTSRPPST